MKTIELEVSRKVFATVLVSVPDDFNDAELMWAINSEAINVAIDEQVRHSDWDDFESESTTEVEQVDTSPEGIEDCEPTDITAALEAVKKRLAESRQLFKDARRAAGEHLTPGE